MFSYLIGVILIGGGFGAPIHTAGSSVGNFTGLENRLATSQKFDSSFQKASVEKEIIKSEPAEVKAKPDTKLVNTPDPEINTKVTTPQIPTITPKPQSPKKVKKPPSKSPIINLKPEFKIPDQPDQLSESLNKGGIKPSQAPLVVEESPKDLQTKKIYTPEQIQNLIIEAAKKYDLNQETLLNLAKCESEFKPDVVHGKNMGVFQININTYNNYAKKYNILNPDPLNPEQNIDLAARMIDDGQLYQWGCQ